MKTLILFMALTFSVSVCSAQEVLELKEARIISSSISSSKNGSWKVLSLNIPEAYAGEFERDPLTFMKNNFDIKLAIAHLGDKDEYEVVFKSRKGKLVADYDRTGNLLYYSLKFQDVLMPYPLMVQIYRDNTGWSLQSNSYEARGRGMGIDESHYKVTMKNGREKKTFKYHTAAENTTGVASN